MKNEMQGLKALLEKHFSITDKDEREMKQFEAEIKKDEDVLQEASNALGQMNAAFQDTQVKEEKIEAQTEAIANEVLQDEAQNSAIFREMADKQAAHDKKIEELTKLVMQSQAGINPNAKDALHKSTVMASIKRNLPNLILENTDPCLSRNNKRYHEVNLKFPTELILAPDSDHENQIMLIQNVLISKEVLFQDWGAYLSNMCDPAMSQRLTNGRGNALAWPRAIFVLLSHIDFFNRSVDKLGQIHAMTPKKGQSLVSFFQEMFKVAYGITEFVCLPSLCTRAAFALKYDFPLKFNPGFVESIESIHDI